MARYLPVGHGFDAAAPLRVQARVLEHGVHDPAAVRGRVGVHCADDQRHLGPGHAASHVTRGLLLGMVVPEVGGQLLVLEHHREIASSLIVESEILGEGL